VGKQAMIAKRDAEPGAEKHHPEQPDLEPVQAEMPQVKRHCGQCEKKGANEKNAGFPMDAMKRNAKNHSSEEDRRFWGVMF